MEVRHRVFLVPGTFGFGQLAGYDYFGHVERALAMRFAAAGAPFMPHVVSALPTASIRRRARALADVIDSSGIADTDILHLVGHSTGGLDARLLATPHVNLFAGENIPSWRRQLRTVVMINSPHHGTPLAQAFASVSGARLLYALSLLTVTTLTLGKAPLAALSSLVAALEGLNGVSGLRVHLVDRAAELILRFIGGRSREEVSTWLKGIRLDQGGIVQISPEVMDLFNAVARDATNVRYGFIATASPSPKSLAMLSKLLSPYSSLSATVYTALHAIASRPNPRYPYPKPDPATAKALRLALGEEPHDRMADGVIPTLSMLHGDLIWCGFGDHLDILGHFRDDTKSREHVDWLRCGAGFNRASFASAMDALAAFLFRPE